MNFIFKKSVFPFILFASFGDGMIEVAGAATVPGETFDLKGELVELEEKLKDLKESMNLVEVAKFKEDFGKIEHWDNPGEASGLSMEAVDEEVLQSTGCDAFWYKMLKKTKKFISFGIETVKYLYCDDSQRSSTIASIDGKLNNMERHLFFGEPDTCTEAFEIVKLKARGGIMKSLADKLSCETEVESELAAIKDVDLTGDRRLFWGAAAKACLKFCWPAVQTAGQITGWWY